MTTPLHGAELLRVLDDHGVEHVIIGGFAVIAHGVIRTTQDLDICPDPAAANLRRLAGAPGDLAYPWLAEDAETAEALGLTLRVASLPKLLAMKRAAGRPQDLEDVARLVLGHGDG